MTTPAPRIPLSQLLAAVLACVRVPGAGEECIELQPRGQEPLNSEVKQTAALDVVDTFRPERLHAKAAGKATSSKREPLDPAEVRPQRTTEPPAKRMAPKRSQRLKATTQQTEGI